MRLRLWSKKSSRWLRPAIFTLSLLLLLVTVVYPISAAAVNSMWGSSSLQSAAASLETEKNQTAQTQALSAQNSFESAASNLQNISWLSKIVGFEGQSANLDHLLQAGANLAEAVQNSAAASSVLVETASKDDLNSDQAITALNKVISNLYTSKDKLEQTKLLLAVVDWNKIPAWLVPPKGFIVDQTAKLQEQIEILIGEINKLI